MMDTWYGTLLISEYGITIFKTYGYGASHGYFITWWLYMLYDWLYVVYSSDYSFPNIVAVKFLSMTFVLLGFGKVGFCEMFAKRGTLQRSGPEVLREEIFENKNVFSI